MRVESDSISISPEYSHPTQRLGFIIKPLGIVFFEDYTMLAMNLTCYECVTCIIPFYVVVGGLCDFPLNTMKT
jgi:hypothetical protein